MHVVLSIHTTALTPGFGEPLTPTAAATLLQDACPTLDGLWVVDVATGSTHLLASHRLLLQAVVLSQEGLDQRTGLKQPVQAPHPEDVGSGCWHWMDKPMVRCWGCWVGFLVYSLPV